MSLHHDITLQAALERQDLSCTYLAHHELESVLIIIIIIIMISLCGKQELHRTMHLSRVDTKPQ